jgi:ADP-heptose:LPS heptosyltransferase
MQQHRRPEETHPNLIDTSADDIYQAAQRMASLDLMITVDSMPAHLAGALGIPVWTLLVAGADWRWMDDREDTPWYPTMRLFRQREAGDWPELVQRVANAVLGERASGLRPVDWERSE